MLLSEKVSKCHINYCSGNQSMRMRSISNYLHNGETFLTFQHVLSLIISGVEQVCDPLASENDNALQQQ